MSEQNTSRAIRYLPQVAVATTAVAVLPVAVVWWLRDTGTVSSPWACVGLAIALSLAASVAGSAFWKRCRGSGDVFFSELLLWGWLHRFRGERRLAKTVDRLGLWDADEHLSTADSNPERNAHLLRQMAAALDAQDPYTDGHSRRVALHCAMVARKMGLERAEIAKLRTAAAVHDIGKLRIPLTLINKPGQLSDAEFTIVRRHADEGADIVSCMEDAEITAMVRHHHERFDGTGYPSGLCGEATPLGARIIAVADTFDALTSVRPYRNAIPHKAALQAIVAASGTQLDPVVVRAFLRCYSGNRAVLFWTLLAVSPQRALAWIRGKAPSHGNLFSIGTVAMPAALAAVVATAVGTAGQVANARPPARLADRTSPQATAVAPAHRRHPARRGAAGPTAGVPLTPRSRHAVLAASRTRGPGHHALVNHSRPAVTGRGRSGSRRGGTGGRGRGPGHPPAPGAGKAPTSSASAPPSSAGNAPPAVTPPPAAASPSAPTTSSPPPTDPGGSGNGGGPTGPTGSTGPGGNGPLTKADCKNGGYAKYGFSNQGQCVASVEQASHP